MGSNRGTRKARRKGVEAQSALLNGRGSSESNPSAPALSFTSRLEAAKLIKLAKSELPALIRLGPFIESLPDKMQTDCFDVIFEHLHAPVEQLLCEKDEPFIWIMASLLGIRDMGWHYFVKDAAHKDRFIRVWPDVFKWLKVFIDVRLIHDESNQFSSIAGQAYAICVRVIPESLFADEVFELAIRAWIGYVDINGKEHYTGHPIISCLHALLGDRGNTAPSFERALHAWDVSAEDLVQKIITRLERTTQSSPINAQEVDLLARIMGHLVNLREPLFPDVALKPHVGPCLVSAMRVVLDGADLSLNYVTAVRSLLAAIHNSLLPQRIGYIVEILENGILGTLLKLSTLDVTHSCEPEHEFLATHVLKKLVGSLIFEKITETSRDVLQILYIHDPQAPDVLKKTPKEFREIWKAFETVVLEHNILTQLFRSCYAPEIAVCTSLACRNLAHRTKFKKCSGCSCTLYCSRPCQKEDWSFHREYCKKIEGNFLQALRDKSIRFARRLLTMQINRHWTAIVERARAKNIALHDMMLHVSYMHYPFIIDILDIHKLPLHRESADVLMFVHEVLRRPQTEDPRTRLPVILDTYEAQFSCIVSMDDKWTKMVSIPKEGRYDRRTSFIYQNGHVVACTNFDAICAGVQLAHEYAVELGKTIWDVRVHHKAVDNVIVEFYEEIGQIPICD